MARGLDHTVKIIFLGDFTVNKTTLLKALCERPPDPEVSCLNPGNDMVEMLFIRDGKRVRVRISDTGGQERFRSITSSFYRSVHGCLLLFDVTKKSTFDSLQGWLKELSINTMVDNVVITLGGCNNNNNNDDDDNDNNRESGGAAAAAPQRQVAQREAQSLAEYLRVPYHELSVKDADSIARAVGELVDRILLKASRVPEFSTSIKPLDQRVRDLREQEEEKEELRSKAKKTTCSC